MNTSNNAEPRIEPPASRWPSPLTSATTAFSLYNVIVNKELLLWGPVLIVSFFAAIACIVFHMKDFKYPISSRSPSRELLIFLNFITLQVGIYALGGLVVSGSISSNTYLDLNSIEWIGLSIVLALSLFCTKQVVAWLGIKYTLPKMVELTGMGSSAYEFPRIQRIATVFLAIGLSSLIIATIILKEPTLGLAFSSIPLQYGFYKVKQFKGSFPVL